MPSPTVNNILQCICDQSNCIEKKRIKWDRRNQELLHIRIDGCVIRDNLTQRCDCFIIYSPNRADLSYIILVETKGKNYSISEVKTQLENGWNAMNTALQDVNAGLINHQWVASMVGSGHNNHRMRELVIRSLTRIKQSKYIVVPTLYAEKKVELLKRTGYSDKFRVVINGEKKKIKYMNCGENLLRIVR